MPQPVRGEENPFDVARRFGGSPGGPGAQGGGFSGRGTYGGAPGDIGGTFGGGEPIDLPWWTRLLPGGNVANAGVSLYNAGLSDTALGNIAGRPSKTGDGYTGEPRGSKEGLGLGDWLSALIGRGYAQPDVVNSLQDMAKLPTGAEQRALSAGGYRGRGSKPNTTGVPDAVRSLFPSDAAVAQKWAGIKALFGGEDRALALATLAAQAPARTTAPSDPAVQASPSAMPVGPTPGTSSMGLNTAAIQAANAPAGAVRPNPFLGMPQAGPVVPPRSKVGGINPMTSHVTSLY